VVVRDTQRRVFLVEFVDGAAHVAYYGVRLLI
jgi:hypothetical protein